MPSNFLTLAVAALAMVLLTFVVGLAILFTRVGEMRRRQIHPRAVSTSTKMAATFENVKPADNFRNLFEVPVLFYALVGVALAIGVVPSWLAMGAWVFVALRVAHSVIHCTYNDVYHRLVVFLAGFVVLVALWVGFVMSLLSRTAA